MNTLTKSRSPSTLRTTVHATLLVAAGAMATGTAIAAELYDIKVIAVGPFSPVYAGPDWGPYLDASVAINDDGDVAFQAVRNVACGIVVGDGESLVTVLDNVDCNSEELIGINNRGQVAFSQTLPGTNDYGIRLWDAGIASTHVSCAGDFYLCLYSSGLADSPAVAIANFSRLFTVGSGGVTGSAVLSDMIYQPTLQTISRDGRNAATAIGGSGPNVWVLDPTVDTNAATFTLCGDIFECALLGISINNFSNVALSTANYRAAPPYTGLVGVISTSPDVPGLIRIADGASGRFGGFGSVSINNLNEVAFAAYLPDGRSGLYVGDVSAREPVAVIEQGDPILPDGTAFGGWTQNGGFTPHGMNDRGQIAFLATISTGELAVLRADPKPGVSPGNPILPGPGDVLPGGGWVFRGCGWQFGANAVNAPCFIDPPVAVGYEYTITEGEARFATVQIPAPLPNGDRQFTIEHGGNSYPLKAGEQFLLTDLDPNGVASFKITGISTAEALDPNDTRAFVTGLMFSGDAESAPEFTMVPIVEDTDGPLTLALKRSEVAGCKSASATITLATPAPAAGTFVTISDTLNAANPPLTVKVPAGAISKRFGIKTTAVANSESGTVSATLDGVTVSQPLTVRPMGVSSVILGTSIANANANADALARPSTDDGLSDATPDATTVPGGSEATGLVKLECVAGPGPIDVALSSTNPAVAAPTVPSLVVPVGAQTAEFAIETVPVPKTTKPKIGAEANGLKKEKTLVVTP